MAVSLSSIIDEELARKLQQEEEDHAQQVLLSQYEEGDIYVESQTYDYFEESTTTTQPPHNTHLPSSTVSLQEEEDFQLALQLQREMELEERNRSKTGNVSVTQSSFCDYYVQKEMNQKNNLNYNSIQKYIQEEQDEEDNGEEYNSKKERKPYGRKKHDPVLNGRKNARTTQEEKGIDTGNLELDRKPNEKESEILLTNKVTNQLKRFSQQQQSRKIRYDDQKKERASSEKVMDIKTRILITKMINLGILTKVYGVISTGKESNVYVGFYSLTGLKEYKDSLIRKKKEKNAASDTQPEHDETPIDEEKQETKVEETQQVQEIDDHESSENDDSDVGETVNLCCVLKIYKTTVSTEFKNREKYMEGEHRFRNRMKHLNPRKLIKQWAEKEYGNLLKILLTSDLRVPVPLLLKKNVLLMSFIGELEQNPDSLATPLHLAGEGGENHGRAFLPAPRLNQIISTLSIKRRYYYYFECILMMRKLYQHCELVHADLSEYNILVHKHHLYFIDLSQGCEVNSANAHEFLKRDCFQITKFFKNATRFQTISTDNQNEGENEKDNNMEKMRFILPLIELFKFITDKSISDSMVSDYLVALKDRLIQQQQTQTEKDIDEEKKREVVFMNTRVATKMSEIKGSIQYDTDNQDFNDTNFLFHQSVLGQRTDMSGPVSDVPELLEDENEDYQDENEDYQDENEDNQDENEEDDDSDSDDF